MLKIEGYACPTCCDVVDVENCPEHPDALMDLFFESDYQTCKSNDGSPWQLRRWDSDGTASLVCTMSGDTQLDSQNAWRIGSALNACREISTLALDHGYIQSLQQLPLLVSDHLADPTPATEERLRKQLALLQSRGRSKDLSNEYDSSEDDDDTDDDCSEPSTFDLNLPKQWHGEVWQTIKHTLAASGFKQEEQYVFSKQLDDGRLGIIHLTEMYKRQSLEISANVAICHQTLIETVQQLTSYPRRLGVRYTELRSEDYLCGQFNGYDRKEADELIAVSSEYIEALSRDYPDLHSICLGLVNRETIDPFSGPIVQAFLGNKKAAVTHANDWVKRWSKYPRNAEGVADYVKNFIPGIKKIKSISIS
ncbi:hypothetical protein KBI23_13695 [bacterium]|nr:hypothetical protein [bacterium]MBP9811189.1 hypothetical protein [bacterium]